MIQTAFQAGTLLACPHCSVILAQFPWQRSVLLNYMIVESKCVMSSVNTHLTLVQHVGSISFLSFLPFSIAFFTCPPCLYLSLSNCSLSPCPLILYFSSGCYKSAGVEL